MTHLTGLPNRLLLANGLADSIASADLGASGTAVIFVDLDGFKFVNDTLGHEAGDALLQQVAQRLSAASATGTCWPAWAATSSCWWSTSVADRPGGLERRKPSGRKRLRTPFLVAATNSSSRPAWVSAFIPGMARM